MRLSFARSEDPGDGRVGATPETVATLVDRGLEIEVETEAGTAAGHDDEAYRQAGVTVVDGQVLVEVTYDRMGEADQDELSEGALRVAEEIMASMD